MVSAPVVALRHSRASRPSVAEGRRQGAHEAGDAGQHRPERPASRIHRACGAGRRTRGRGRRACLGAERRRAEEGAAGLASRASCVAPHPGVRPRSGRRPRRGRPDSVLAVAPAKRGSRPARVAADRRQLRPGTGSERRRPGRAGVHALRHSSGRRGAAGGIQRAAGRPAAEIFSGARARSRDERPVLSKAPGGPHGLRRRSSEPADRGSSTCSSTTCSRPSRPARRGGFRS